MNEFPRQKLIEVVEQYGLPMLEDPRRLESLLTYLCGDEYKPEIRLLMDALDENVAKDLLVVSKRMAARWLLASLVARLEDHLLLTKDQAVWAVESWALSLGLDLPGQKSTAADPDLPGSVDWKAYAWMAWWHIKSFPAQLMQQTRLGWALMFDARVPTRHKLIPIIAVAYIISPLGLIVDLIPVAGLLTNLGVYMLALVTFNNLAPADVVAAHTERLRIRAKTKRNKTPNRRQADRSRNKPRSR